ncbi:g98 [Coccomyxa viridis]|uniref:fructose-bisphosphatase n=1 Tax=Coccomyxa viridis TaxID=1274662 RepID=A0ABP1FHW5_9CHLO
MVAQAVAQMSAGLSAASASRQARVNLQPAICFRSGTPVVGRSTPVSSRNGMRRQGSSSFTVKAVAAVEEKKASKTERQQSQYELNTFTTWLLKEEQKGTVDGELAIVLSSIALACKQIASLVTRAGISNLTGLGGLSNSSGEDQKKLDIVSNEVFCNALRNSGKTGVIASEEEDLPVAVEETYSGNYVVVFDPLDGSSNIDAGISTGSIFGIYAPSDECSIDDMDDPEKMMQNCILNVCQPGSSLLAAGYCLYSSSTVFVITVGDGVYGFTYDSIVGEFILSHPDMKVPDKGKIYSFNEGNYGSWAPHLQDYINSLKDASKWDGKPYSSRYIGSLVGDFHRTLLYGGIYGYPGDSKNPTGKLRLLYECAPMSLIVEQAGGLGSTGEGRVLDVCPEKVHQRVPLFIGSKGEVEYLESFYKKA